MPMSFAEIWAQLTRKDASLEDADAKVSMSAGNLKRLLRQVYDQGAAARKVATPPRQAPGDGDPFSSFRSIFGGDP